MLTKDQKILRSRFENSFASVSERIGIGVFDERAKKPIKKPGLVFFLFGVILPAIALYFEVSTHTMAGILFDPFPTPWHVLLFSFIPLSNLIVFLAVRFNMVSFYAITSLMSGFAMGMAILYSLMFATKLPAMASTFIYHSELSFLVIFHPLLWAPLFAIAPLFNAGHVITLLGARQKAFFDGDQLKHFGHIVILIMVLSIEAPSTITRIYISKAINYESSAKLISGYDKDSVNWLRSWGNREVMLRSCYERSGRATDILGSLYEDQHPVPVERARELFYIVTGQSFNEVAIPSSFRSTLKHTGAMNDVMRLNGNADDEFDIDTDIAGSKVSGFARGLSTSDSSIKGKIDSKTGIASFDWSCTFENATYVPREARAQIRLPHGACVSGATIWLDGKKKEAKIEEKSLARSTYINSVYTQKKDPLLVSMTGPSTVLVQCYPVVRGQVTKIDLHIIAPLQPISKDKTQMVLPVFSERNFAFKNDNKVDLECATKFDIKGNVIEIEAPLHANAFQSVNPKPDTLYVVIDGSGKMQPYMSEIAEGLKSSSVSDIHIVKVLDGETVYKSKEDAIKDLATTKCVGGQDTSRSLSDSMTRCLFKRNGSNKSSAILWLHGPQPVCNANSSLFLSNIVKDLKFSNIRIPIFDYQVLPGSSKLLEDMDMEQVAFGTRQIVSTGHPKADLDQFWTTLRKTDKTPYHDFSEDKNASEDLNILRAYTATMNNFALFGYQNPTLYLCRNYHIVSPITSLVVVPDENAVAYDEESAPTFVNEKCKTIINKISTNNTIKREAATENGEYYAPKQVACKEQKCSNDRQLKNDFAKAPASTPGRSYHMKKGRLKAEAGAGAGGSVGGSLSNARLAQKDSTASYEISDVTDVPVVSDAKENNSVISQVSNSVTDKLSSLSQSACQTSGPREMESSQNKAGKHGFINLKTSFFYLLILIGGLVLISNIKAGRFRK